MWLRVAKALLKLLPKSDVPAGETPVQQDNEALRRGIAQALEEGKRDQPTQPESPQAETVPAKAPETPTTIEGDEDAE
jgi:hypothetical protein